MLTMAPPTPSATGASYAGKAVRFYYEELEKCH
jgi:hypothetical protein